MLISRYPRNSIAQLLSLNVCTVTCHLHNYTADSKVALGIGNWAQGRHCLVVTQANHCIVSYAQTPNC